MAGIIQLMNFALLAFVCFSRSSLLDFDGRSHIVHIGFFLLLKMVRRERKRDKEKIRGRERSKGHQPTEVCTVCRADARSIARPSYLSPLAESSGLEPRHLPQKVSIVVFNSGSVIANCCSFGFCSNLTHNHSHHEQSTRFPFTTSAYASQGASKGVSRCGKHVRVLQVLLALERS